MNEDLLYVYRLFVLLLALSAISSSVPPARAAEKSAGVSFFVDQITVWAGSTQVIPITLSGPSATDITFDTSISNDGAIKLLRSASVLNGHAIGFLRVRGVKAGKAKLTVAKQSIDVIVRPFDSALAKQNRRPRVVGPISGAHVWSTFAVGVEIFADATGGGHAVAPKVTLRLPDGKTLEPHRELASAGPTHRYIFDVDASTLSPAPVALSAIASYADGKTFYSAPVIVNVIHHDPKQLIAGECEDTLATHRPERFGKVAPKVGSHSKASGGTYVQNHGTNPAWCFPVDVKTAGLYQFVVVARGDLGGEALPTIGLYIDESIQPATTGRLVDRRWHRTPIGKPVQLETGKHVLTARFMNDFWVKDMADRNLFLDRYELLPVKPDPTRTAPSSMAMVTPADPGNTLRIAFARPLHDLAATGELTIEGYCWWADIRTASAAYVTLLVNGKPVASQQGAAPIFVLDRNYLKAGPNTIQLLAHRDNGAAARTPTQTIHAEGAFARDDPPREYHRYNVLDARWDNSIKPMLSDKSRPAGHSVAAVKPGSSLTLNLPDELGGDYDLFLDGRSKNYNGPPRAAITVTADGRTIAVAEKPISGWWLPRRFGKLSLKKGPKSLTVTYTNGLNEKDEGRRKLWVRAIVLRENARQPDHIAPRASIAYPKSEQHLHMADAVVVDVVDDRKIRYVDLYIDGRAQSLHKKPERGVGRVIFPLLLRELSPGTHHLNVRVQDQAGNIGDGDEVEFVVETTPPAAPNQYQRAIHLLNRFAYGPDPAELAAVLTMGEKAWLSDRLSRSFLAPGDAAALGNAVARYSDSNAGHHIRSRIIQHLMLTDNPVRARFVMWTQNHFSTWLRKTGSMPKWEEFLRFSQLGPQPFGELLLASATSPAMLFYLDQQRSAADQLNENYAREFMELHSLGVNGGYTQTDVTALAGLITGWTVSQEADAQGTGDPLAQVYRYAPHLNNGHPQRIFGMAFDDTTINKRYDNVRLAIEMLAAHPSTASFISRKLVEHYVGTPAPKAIVDELADTFMTTGGDMKQMLLALAAHPKFFAADGASRLATPLGYTLRIARTTTSDPTAAAVECTSKSGMGVFDRAAPDGYPEDDASWADSNAMVQRWHYAQRCRWSLRKFVPGPWHRQPRTHVPQWRQKVVDAVAVGLTGNVLGEASNDSALVVLAAPSKDDKQRSLKLVTFISQLPEASLR